MNEDIMNPDEVGVEGLEGLKGLSRDRSLNAIKNPEIRKRVEERLEKYKTNTPAEFNQRLTEVGRSLPALEFVGDTPGLGESRYDKNITLPYQLNDLNEFRAQYQP